jgi:hypothetical protein
MGIRNHKQTCVIYIYLYIYIYTKEWVLYFLSLYIYTLYFMIRTPCDILYTIEKFGGGYTQM